MATGAAAVTSKVSSNCFTNSDSSISVISFERVEQVVGAELRHGGVASSSYRIECVVCGARYLGRRLALALFLQGRRQADGLAQRRLEQVAAALLRLAFIAPASLASSTSRDSRSASFVTSAAESGLPSKTPPLITSKRVRLSELAQALAASTTIARDEGERGRTGEQVVETVMPASAAARFASVFFATAYVACGPECPAQHLELGNGEAAVLGRERSPWRTGSSRSAPRRNLALSVRTGLCPPCPSPLC